ncbi:MAG: glycosyltransferase family 1 protein [Anaerolineales bacterium]|nr:glycosyltransferase family 1 protein [Anaerolineales bacterium]
MIAKLRFRLEYSLRQLGDKSPRLTKYIISSDLFTRMGRLRALGEMLTLHKQGLLHQIFVFTDTNNRFFQSYKLPSHIVPMGYHPQFGELRHQTRDIDVLFLGSTRDRRRKKILLNLEQVLLAKGIRFVIKDGSPERGYAFGSERTSLLNRSKIMLNIMRQPWDDPVFRLILAAPNGAMCLSETLLPTSMGLFQENEHFVMASLSQMVRAIEYYLTHDSLRNQIAMKAHELVTTKLTMTNMAKQIIQIATDSPI